MTQAPRFHHRHLLGIEPLSAGDITAILDRAEIHYERNRQADRKQASLRGRTLINAFFENSTRTRTSFELAGKRLGADVINMSLSTSSTAKGETLIDTARTLDAMQMDFLVVRHGESRVPQLLARHIRGSIINAGDGCRAHPTQALLDAFTIRRHKGKLDGLKVTICGDILHSRVARSNITLLRKFGCELRVVAPPTLMPADVAQWGATPFHRLGDGVEGADVVIMLRLQLERMKGSFVPSMREYFHLFGLTHRRLDRAAKNAIVMHPGPMNRGVEIHPALADDPERSVILHQVEAGVAVRQAILELLDEARGLPSPATSPLLEDA